MKLSTTLQAHAQLPSHLVVVQRNLLQSSQQQILVVKRRNQIYIEKID